MEKSGSQYLSNNLLNKLIKLYQEKGREHLLNVNSVPDTDLDALHILPHLIATVTPFYRRNSAEHMASGATPGHNLCFVWSQQAENNDKYEEEEIGRASCRERV